MCFKTPGKIYSGSLVYLTYDGSHRFTAEAKKILNRRSQTVKCGGTNEFRLY